MKTQGEKSQRNINGDAGRLSQQADMSQVERIIERAKREWEATFDTVNDMIVLTDCEGRVIRVNKSTASYLNKSYTELLGHPIEQVFWGNSNPDAKVFVEGCKSVQFPALAGWFDVASYPLLVEGELSGNVHVISDVTERHQAQTELRKINDELETRVWERTQELTAANVNLQHEIQERQNIQSSLEKEKDLLSTTLFSIRDGVIATDRDGIVTLFNKAAEQITGQLQETALGKPFNEVIWIFDDETGQVSTDPLAILLGKRQRKTAVDHLVLLDSSGSRQLISSSAAPIHNKDGARVGYVMVINNITEQKRIEAQLALSQKMESIGQLAAGISHEINTPMQYVGDNMRFLEEAFQNLFKVFQFHTGIMDDKGTPAEIMQRMAEQRELRDSLDLDYYISEIPAAIQQSLEGIERVRKIVLAMKAFSHPTNKEKRLSDINQGIETTITISRNEWKYTADLETDLDANLPLVYCAIDDINQVILNIIINAAQAIAEKIKGGEKGKITVTTRGVGDNISISIQDSGVGIPEENLNRIFDLFFTTKVVGKGTGQGLSLAHNIIVNEHKGKILVDSEVGKGATFTIWLPVQEEAAPEKVVAE